MSIHLSWDNKPERQSWSAALLESVDAAFPRLEAGNPEQFLSGYLALDPEGRRHFWGEFFVQIASFESSWRPSKVTPEPELDEASVGLLQLSYGDQENYPLGIRLDSANRDLENPVINLQCGVKIMAHWLEKDGVVATSNGKVHRGGARYWSVLRPGAKREAIREGLARELQLPHP